MLRVTLEMVPFGVEAAKRTLGVMEISNIGGTPKDGNYKITMSQREKEHFAEAELKHYPRKNGAWSLVLLALGKIDFR